MSDQHPPLLSTIRILLVEKYKHIFRTGYQATIFGPQLRLAIDVDRVLVPNCIYLTLHENVGSLEITLVPIDPDYNLILNISDPGFHDELLSIMENILAPLNPVS